MASSPVCTISPVVAQAVRQGLANTPKTLPPWLFYDETGSVLFEGITQLPEYYLTRTERGIFAMHGDAILRAASAGSRLRIAELGAGTAEKTRLLLAAACRLQPAVLYEPIDVSATALEAARVRIAAELPAVTVVPYVEDYTVSLALEPTQALERRLVLYIGSSIGNFEPEAALDVLRGVRAGLAPGDSILLGVDLVKGEDVLLSAYDDAAGVTAAFNRNLLVRLNRELDADFDPALFAHRAVWNAGRSRIEMHLESLAEQTVRIPALEMTVRFREGERLHTENSYKYAPGRAEALLAEAGFGHAQTWTDARGWFAVILASAA